MGVSGLRHARGGASPAIRGPYYFREGRCDWRARQRPHLCNLSEAAVDRANNRNAEEQGARKGMNAHI